MSVTPIDPAEAMRAVRAALPLRTERLVLRTLVPTDAERVAEYRNAPGQRQWTYNRDQTEAEIMAWTAGGAPVLLKDGDAMQVGIEQDGLLVGDVMLRITSFESKQVELGWMVAKEHQGRGIATEAARAVLDLAFTIGAHRVFAHIDAENLGSWRVCERIGMHVEAHYVEDEVNPATGEFGSTVKLAIRR